MGKQRKQPNAQNTPLPVLFLSPLTDTALIEVVWRDGVPTISHREAMSALSERGYDQSLIDARIDDWLINAVCCGGTATISHRDAMNALITRHFDAVFHYLRRRGLQSVDAESVAWVVFTNAFAHADSYHPQPTTTFSNWLMGIAHHAAVDHQRRASRHVAGSIDESPVPLEDTQRARSPIAYLLNRELAEVTEEGLNESVTNHQRLVLEVAYGLLPDGSDACVSGNSRSTQLTRGLERLGEYVARRWGGAEWLTRLEQLDEADRRRAHRRIGEEGMEALSRQRLDSESDSDTPREQS